MPLATLAMDRISQNKEILHNIIYRVINHHHHRRKTSCISVCKSWSDVALDILWRKIHQREFFYVFKILCPLKQGEKPGAAYVFHRDPTSADWMRFEKYSRRVRVLEINLNRRFNYRDLRVDPTVYGGLAISRPASGVFPNLTELELDGRLGHWAPLFLNPGMKVLRIALDYPMRKGEAESCNNPAYLFNQVLSRMSDLRELSISIAGRRLWGSCYTAYKDEALICQLLLQQPHLRRLSLPWSWFTTRVAEAVAFLPNLTSICPAMNANLGHPLDSLIFNPVVLPGAFSSIQDLSLATPYPQFQRFLLNWIPSAHVHSRLKSVSIHSQVLESPQTMQGMLEVLVPRCPGLTSLKISSLCSTAQMPYTNSLPYQSYNGQDRPTDRSPSEWTLKRLDPFRVTLDTISSLFQLDHIHCLHLNHHLPAAFSPSDIESFASKFCHLKDLDLFSDPHPIYIGGNSSESEGSSSDSSLYDEIVKNDAEHATKGIPEHTHTLRTFGSKCPKLESLRVFVDPRPQSPTIDDSLPNSDDAPSQSWPINYFPNLRELYFGSSYCCDSMAGSLAFVFGEYLDPSTYISSAHSVVWEDEDEAQWRQIEDDYIQRLRKGGRIHPSLYSPNIEDGHGGLDVATMEGEATQVDSNDNSAGAPQVRQSIFQMMLPKRYEAWKIGTDGQRIQPDQAVFTSPTGDPLVFDISAFLGDTTMYGTMGGVIERSDGSKWMPGVGFSGWLSKEIITELKARGAAWRSAAKLMPLMRTLRLQEKKLLEERLKAFEVVGNDDAEAVR
ncbi:hypothetical protein BDN72DRAFT_960827 [Pluteus cervinus]|uniref:Uncharacterized protein n=1 Tax=Pluteus cervinus TaxID=181527 RepID=A0ACD3AP03_9AGAR|nr:hypothetical protein BDN72DRAFT_960827 [Pluteus cervinus]